MLSRIAAGQAINTMTAQHIYAVPQRKREGSSHHGMAVVAAAELSRNMCMPYADGRPAASHA